MTVENHQHTVEQEREADPEGRVAVRRVGVFRTIFRGLLWPFSVVVRVYRGVWWALGFGRPKEAVLVTATPVRQSLSCRKRLHRATRLLLGVLPCWLQAGLGYPVSSSIGRSLSPEVSVSPTKLNGKGSKRKQDEMDDDEEEEEPQSWVEVLSQELKDEDSEVDPDYEPSTVETESEEYQVHNDTESEGEISATGVLTVIEDVNTTVDPEGSPPAV